MTTATVGRMACFGLTAAVLPFTLAAECDKPPATSELTWAVYDQDASDTKELSQNSKAYASARHRVIVTFRASDPGGVTNVATWADRRGSSVLCRDTIGASYEIPSQVGLPRVDTPINPGLYYGFSMRPAMVANQLSCGRHDVGDNALLNFHVVSGTIRYEGEETTANGDKHEVFLDVQFVP
jgi:hypothetical protein